MGISLSPALIKDYADAWRRMEPNDQQDARRVALRIERGRSRYEEVERLTGVPWWIVGTLHYRENGSDMGMPNEVGKFQAYLGNGEPLTRKTTIAPTGRGPFETWQRGAEDALGLKLKVQDGGYQHISIPAPYSSSFRYVEVCAFFFELWNGLGYRIWHPEVPSEYLWGLSSVHCRGKYTSDGKFDPNSRTKQHGAMVCLYGLAALGIIDQPTCMDLPQEPDPEAWYERVLLQQFLNKVSPRSAPLKIDGAIGPNPETSPTRRRLADVGLVLADQLKQVA